MTEQELTSKQQQPSGRVFYPVPAILLGKEQMESDVCYILPTNNDDCYCFTFMNKIAHVHNAGDYQCLGCLNACTDKGNENNVPPTIEVINGMFYTDPTQPKEGFHFCIPLATKEVLHPVNLPRTAEIVSPTTSRQIVTAKRRRGRPKLDQNFYPEPKTSQHIANRKPNHSSEANVEQSVQDFDYMPGYSGWIPPVSNANTNATPKIPASTRQTRYRGTKTPYTGRNTAAELPERSNVIRMHIKCEVAEDGLEPDTTIVSSRVETSADSDEDDRKPRVLADVFGIVRTPRIRKVEPLSSTATETPVYYVPSQQRGPEVVFFPLPDKRFCYEFSLRRVTSAGVHVYSCSGCRATKERYLKMNVGSEINVAPAAAKVQNGKFLNDPLYPDPPHICQPKDSKKCLLHRQMIRYCNELRVNPTRKRNDIIAQLDAVPLVEDFSESVTEALVSTVSEHRRFKSAQRVIERNIQRGTMMVRNGLAGADVKESQAYFKKYKHAMHPVSAKKEVQVFRLDPSIVESFSANTVPSRDVPYEEEEVVSTRDVITEENSGGFTNAVGNEETMNSEASNLLRFIANTANAPEVEAELDKTRGTLTMAYDRRQGRRWGTKPECQPGRASSHLIADLQTRRSLTYKRRLDESGMGRTLSTTIAFQQKNNTMELMDDVETSVTHPTLRRTSETGDDEDVHVEID